MMETVQVPSQRDMPPPKGLPNARRPGVPSHPMVPGMPSQRGAPARGFSHQFGGPMAVSAPGEQLHPRLMGGNPNVNNPQTMAAMQQQHQLLQQQHARQALMAQHAFQTNMQTNMQNVNGMQMGMQSNQLSPQQLHQPRQSGRLGPVSSAPVQGPLNSPVANYGKFQAQHPQAQAMMTQQLALQQQQVQQQQAQQQQVQQQQAAHAQQMQGNPNQGQPMPMTAQNMAAMQQSQLAASLQNQMANQQGQQAGALQQASQEVEQMAQQLGQQASAQPQQQKASHAAQMQNGSYPDPRHQMEAISRDEFTPPFSPTSTFSTSEQRSNISEPIGNNRSIHATISKDHTAGDDAQSAVSFAKFGQKIQWRACPTFERRET